MSYSTRTHHQPKPNETTSSADDRPRQRHRSPSSRHDLNLIHVDHDGLAGSKPMDAPSSAYSYSASSQSPSYANHPHHRSSVSDLSQPLELLQMASASSAGGDGSQFAPASRVSSASGKSNRGSPQDKQLSQIEKSVTHLLVATKQLLETLTQWSRQNASEGDVSDVYVRLGYEFNLACRAFGAIGVDTSDLGPVPDLLRSILEDTLSQDASRESLDRFLPRIRDIIINLLHGLKKKQAKLRSKQAREGKPVPRQMSSGSIGSGDPIDELSNYPPSPSKTPEPRRGTPHSDEQGAASRRDTSSTWSSDRQGGSFSEREAVKREIQKTIAPSASSSSVSSSAMQNMPVLPPHAENNNASNAPKSEQQSSYAQSFPHPPPPPPSKQNDAIGMLQRSGELERRASRRFSQYQIQKHLGTATNGVPVMPTQPSQVPNKGKDVRESLNAVRLRGSINHGRQRSNNRVPESSSTRSLQTEGDVAATPPKAEQPSEPADEADSPMKTPTDKYRATHEFDRDLPVVGGKLPGLPEAGEGERESLPPDDKEPPSIPEKGKEPAAPEPKPAAAEPSVPAQFSPESSPQPGKELTLFLQYKSKIKKHVLPEGSSDLTIGRLQLAFIEKFAWNTHGNGADLPEIYIQDPVSGVRHELEDLSDVKDRCVLVLNVEPLDEVKKHFDDSVGGLRRLVEGVRDVVDGQGTAIQRLTDGQLEAAKDIARLAVAPPTPSPSVAAAEAGQAKTLSQPPSGKSSQHSELQSLRRDLAVMRKTYSNFVADITSSMDNVRSKASSVKSTAVEVAIPNYEGDAGRAHIIGGKKELASESEKLVDRVDGLQDLVEDLRKDVVTRGVRPLPRQLEAVGRDISDTTKELKRMQEFLKREKPIWTKIWEKELQLVCEERDQLTMQEDLAVDLEDDLEKATQTFALVEQATKQQNVTATNGGTGTTPSRNASRTLPVDPSVDPHKAKDNVLGEVRALQPNHENRVEAIERAEKARQKELEQRRDGVLQKELRNFVNDKKLKKTGMGIEEMEEHRKEKEEQIRRQVWERQMGLAPAEEAPAATQNNEGSAEAQEFAEPAAEEDSPPEGQDGKTDPQPRDATPTQQQAEGRNSTDPPVSPSKRSSWLPSIFSPSSTSS